MEDGALDAPLHTEIPVGDGVASPIMANSPDGTSATEGREEGSPKLNGITNNQSDYSSESDALVIDEGGVPKQKPKDTREFTSPHHYNPYFNESIVELSRQHHHHQLPTDNKVKFGFKNRRLNKAKNSPKLREYAQYLGLQPTVQFKCSKCGRAGFESLPSLNEHIVQCTEEAIVETPPQQGETSSSSFKLTRKVFLCSACGTYYENWNLYIHMLEVHRRYLCLHCLGMFSVLDDLCAHIQSRHHFEPGYKDTPDDFFNTYSDPCYILCCDCGLLFNEQDNFFYHTCPTKKVTTKNNNKIAKPVKSLTIRPENHVTGDSSNQINGLEPANNQIRTNSEEINVPVTRVTEETEESDRLVVKNTQENDWDECSNPGEDLRGFDDKGEPIFASKIESDDEEEEGEEEEEDELPETREEVATMEVETRKVPKLSLKLKPGSFPEIDQSYNVVSDEEKPIHGDLEQIESENEVNCSTEKSQDNLDVEKEGACEEEDAILVAGVDVPINELELEQPLDKFDIRILIQKCLKETAPTCIYCNHARKIAVNGKQLGLHAIAEHRYSAVVHSITAEELIPESFVACIKQNLSQLDQIFFSLESGPSDEAVTFSHVFECYQCRYATSIHKELYLHNRKSHAKNLLLCIMCKSNFYSYSELICHLCPGLYVLDYEVHFRCCMCVGDDLPSAFRLMVHLRKRHHVCDVCLEMCHSQYKLSNHVWKHKLHHFCYRCGIAYRNKPDITRHLFWKHGTESVMCKKCLQKKWPHVYHFCVPPSRFQCEECTLTFSRAVSLKVHKRLHGDIKPHACTVEGCDEKFISKKLLNKHEVRHREPPEVVPEEVQETKTEVSASEVANDEVIPPNDEDKEADLAKNDEKEKKKVDLYDLPALNLSESDSSDSEAEAVEEKSKVIEEEIVETNQAHDLEILLDHGQVDSTVTNDDVEVVPANIWDDFKNYQATKEKFDHLLEAQQEPSTSAQIEAQVREEEEEEEVLTLEKALMDHDYCIDPNNKPDISFTEVKPDLSQSVDHDYCSTKTKVEEQRPSSSDIKEPVIPADCNDGKNAKRSSSSDSSSDSGSSSCSCGPNCSCSSSSDSSTSDSSGSDSSTEEGRRRQQVRRDRRRLKKVRGGAAAAVAAANSKAKAVHVLTPADANRADPTKDVPIEESDLETTESETDEEFYDRQPQKLAKKMMEEKRNQLLAGIDHSPNGSFFGSSRAGTPNNLPDEVAATTQEVKKKKSKSKKKKKKKNRESKQYYQPPITLTLSRSSPTVRSPMLPMSKIPKIEATTPRDDTASGDGLRASKRRRVPNKFYGYSSDEDEPTPPKWKPQQQAQAPALIVPPITIKTGPPPPGPTPKVQPFSIRTTPGQMKVQHRRMPPIRLKQPKTDADAQVVGVTGGGDSDADSNDSSGNEGRNVLQVNPDALYCYCKCPYDEVSEMIGCDSRDCSIEWFHFECVGIMVPPKGHWYCPECRKKRQQKRDLLKIKLKTNV